jgi:serpin B
MEGVGEGGRAPGLAVASEKERQVSPDVSDADLHALVEGNSTFAFELYRLLAEREGNENLFYSPYSISLALAMTHAGAHGETEQEMAEALHFILSQENLHPAFNALDQELAQRGERAEGKDDADKEHQEGFRLNVANAIWGQKGYQFVDTFLDVLAENYGAGLRTLDFAGSPEESRVVINDWVSEETEGKIEDLLPQGSIDALTRLVLTNAIYFKAAWANPFEEADTREGTFSLLDGGEASVPMMRQSESLGYAEGEGYQAVELPYDGREMSTVIVVPEEGEFEAFEESLDAGRVEATIEQLSRRQVALTMPTFEFDARFSLKEALAALGMPQAFSEAADFSGMTGKKDLFISDVFHKAFVSVDEAGTEAAAATAVVMKLTSAASDPVEVNVDRPFLFLIRDVETGAILFVGRVVDPSA